MVEKPTPSTLVGIGLKRNAHGNLVIGKVFPTGLFSHSLLSSEDRVISINGIESRRLRPKDAVNIIRSSPRFVTIVTETQLSTGVVIAAASAHPYCAASEEEAEPERTPDTQRKYATRSCVITVAVLVVLVVDVALWKKVPS